MGRPDDSERQDERDTLWHVLRIYDKPKPTAPQSEDEWPSQMDPMFRHLYRFLGAVLFAMGCAIPILVLYEMNRKGDIPPAARAQVEQQMRAHPHGHPYFAAFFITAFTVLLIVSGVRSFKGSTWAARWFFPLFFGLGALAELLSLFW